MVIKMYKRAIMILIIFSLSLLTTGCWNYVGLNDMTVISGIAIDKIDDDYKLSFEIYNLQETTTGEPIKSEIIETTGKTIFDAVRNAKKKISNKLYFSDAKVIIISQDIAKEDGINNVLDWFFRDPEIRETIGLVISQEETASAFFKVDGLTNTIVSNDIKNIIEKDQAITSSTEMKQLYKVFDILNNEGESLVLPAIRLIENNDENVCEVNGIAVFKEDKLVDYLSSEETKYYLLAKGLLKGGIITINTKLNNDEESQKISLEVKSSNSSQEYTSLEENNLTIKVSTSTDVTLSECADKDKKLKEENIVELEKKSASLIKRNIEKVIKKIQNNFDTDILGYGKKIYQKYPKKWTEIQDDYEEMFKNITVEVESKVKIYNTGFIK